MDFDCIKKIISDAGADLYLATDYEFHHPLLREYLGKAMLTRKLFWGIRKDGSMWMLHHKIDRPFLLKVKNEVRLIEYRTWEEMLSLLKKEIEGDRKIMMDISEKGLLPRVSLADYGTVEFIESQGKEIISSADLLQMDAMIDEEGFALQKEASRKNLMIKDEAFAYIGEVLSKGQPLNEYMVQQFIVARYKEEGTVFDEPPIVATTHHASDPHYGPTEEVHGDIKEGDLILIDMWAKMDKENAPYSDITWMAYIGNEIPEIYAKAFSILRKAVDSGLNFLSNELPKRAVKGYEVDRVVRGVVEQGGYGEYFTHRTGHNIADGESPHGPGANIDDYESHDERTLLDNTSFSLEPGIYCPDFGMRLETDVFVKNRKPLEIGGHQNEIILIKIKR